MSGFGTEAFKLSRQGLLRAAVQSMGSDLTDLTPKISLKSAQELLGAYIRACVH